MSAIGDQGFPWFRMWCEAIDDDKVLQLDDADFGRFVKLLCMKRAGVIDSSAPHLDRRILAKMRSVHGSIEPEELAALKARLIDVGLIDDQWQPIAWCKRQLSSDSDGAERMRRYRKRQRDVTVTSRCDESDVLETESDTETESEPDTPPVDGGSAEGVRSRTPQRRASRRMPKEWEVSADLLVWIAAECPLVDFEAELRTIRDYEFKTAHTDWDATVRNWLRREQKNQEKYTRAPNGRGPESRFQRMQRRLDEI